MPTYCIPDLSSVPGFSAFDWWTAGPDPTNLQYSPDNPNWLGSFSISAGSGANRHVQIRLLKGTIAAQSYLFVSCAVRVASTNPLVDHVNFILGDGTNCVAFQARAGTASATVAGKQDDGIFIYRVHKCTLTALAPPSTDKKIEQVNPGDTSTASYLEQTGRMWVDVTSPGRGLLTKWAFQIAVPLGTAWGPAGGQLTLPASGAFKFWYEAWTSLSSTTPGPAVPYHSPLTPANVETTSVLQVVPPGPNNLLVSHLLDVSTGAVCDAGVTMDWGNVGVRNIDGTARPSPWQLQLDLGQNYPPNLAAPPTSTAYNENHTPNVSLSQNRNQIFAKPTLPAGLTQAQQDSLRARFSLANWGSQYSTPTPNSWRPVPGGEDVNYQAGEMKFVWPTVADSYTTTLVRNINRYLNVVGVGMQPPSSGSGSANYQNPHHCMLVELSSTDGSVVITRSSIYSNMNVVSVSVFERLAQISVVGLPAIGAQPRDVYLYLQTFNMPKVVKDQDRPRPGPSPDTLRVGVTGGRQQFNEVEDIAAQVPTYVVHAYHDTGRKLTLEDGRQVPIVEPQTSFGYFAVHEGSLYGWETRIYGAEKITGDLYRVRVPNNGSVYVETAIQARESASEAPLRPDGRVNWCTRLANWLDSKGFIGRLLALIVRVICRVFGRA